jgi:histidine decarboxylase
VYSRSSLSQFALSALAHPLSSPREKLQELGLVDYSPLSTLLSTSAFHFGDQRYGTTSDSSLGDYEDDVIRSFAQWYGLEASERWGYVTSGSSEGNLFGLLLARERFPNGIVYFSESTHRGVQKNLRVLKLRSIMVPCSRHGEINYEELKNLLAVNLDAPAIILANLGSRDSGAIDNIVTLNRLRNELGIERWHLHVNASTSGMVLPFVEKPQPYRFEQGIDTMSLSCHTLLGSPLACGVLLASAQLSKRLARATEYVGLKNLALRSSRNALPPLFLWHALHHLGEGGLSALCSRSLSLAKHLSGSLKDSGIDSLRNFNSVTVTFPSPSWPVISKWRLGASTAQSNRAHTTCLPWMDEEKISLLAHEIICDLKGKHDISSSACR